MSFSSLNFLSVRDNLFKIILLNQHERHISIVPKSLLLFIWHFFPLSVYFVLLVGGAVFVSCAFSFPFFSTRSALLPVPQVFLQEPFLNAKANKRKNVSFHGWQDNKAQRVGSRFVASSSRLRTRALGTGAPVGACRCPEL